MLLAPRSEARGRMIEQVSHYINEELPFIFMAFEGEPLNGQGQTLIAVKLVVSCKKGHLPIALAAIEDEIFSAAGAQPEVEP